MNSNSYNIEEKEKMQIVIFGLGKIYKDNFHNISRSDEIVAFSDNDKNLQGKVLEGKKIVSPIEICELSYDKIVIMVSYPYACQIKNQLIEFGISCDQILYWEQYIHMQNKYDVSPKMDKKNLKNILIVTWDLGYHGGAMVCIFLAEVLQKEGFGITIVAPSGSNEFIGEYRRRGFYLELLKGIQYSKVEKIEGISKYDYVIANTYPMILFALEICNKVRTILWLHESENVYATMEFWNPDVREKVKNSKINIYAVSEMAKRNYINQIGQGSVLVLEYGIPDVLVKPQCDKSQITFAVIGTIFSLKQQHMFIEAVESLQMEQKNNNRFWIIGKIADSQYAETILKQIENKDYIQYLGEKSQEELNRLYDEIDVVVICSEQESLPIVAVEGFVRGKPCIICDNTGLSKYVYSKKAGIIYKTNNVHELQKAIQFSIDNMECLKQMGKRARELYEDQFSLQKFKERFLIELKNSLLY